MNARPILTIVICRRLAPILEVHLLVLAMTDILVMVIGVAVSCMSNDA